MARILIKKLSEDAVLPTAGSQYAAGSDLYALIPKGELTIPPHRSVMVHTGLSFALPEGTFGAVFARSGIASREGLRPANCVGVIDSDYRGECMVSLHNDSDCERRIQNGERIAQLVLLPYLPAEYEETENLPDTARGAGGFGSTGK